MGQRASRALASRLDKGLQKYRHEMEQDIYRTIADKKQRAAAAAATAANNKQQQQSQTYHYTDPNAMETGFTRGHSPPIRQDEEQEAFLKAQQQQLQKTATARRGSTATNGNENTVEMPDELIQFLNDMGPVERRKERKGPRLRRHQLQQQQQEEEELELQQQQQDGGRQKRDMPILEGADSFTTTRTTNFSKRIEEDDPFATLTGRQLYQHLLSHAQNNGSNNDNKTYEVVVENVGNHIHQSDDQRKVYAELLQNSLRYMQIPVIMKDTDGSYVGVPPERVQDMKRIKVTEVPDSEVRILLSVQDPGEQEQQD